MVVRRIFGHDWNEVREGSRKLHNEELSDMYCSPNIFRMIKSRILRWAGHVARMGDRKVVYRIVNLAEALWEHKCNIIVSNHLHKLT
jgi:hypothetical protein